MLNSKNYHRSYNDELMLTNAVAWGGNQNLVVSQGTDHDDPQSRYQSSRLQVVISIGRLPLRAMWVAYEKSGL